MKTGNSSTIHAPGPQGASREPRARGTNHAHEILNTHICEKPANFVTGKILPVSPQNRVKRQNPATYEKHVKIEKSTPLPLLGKSLGNAQTPQHPNTPNPLHPNRPAM